MRSAVMVLIVMSVAVNAYCEETKPARYVCRYVKTPPDIDARIDKYPWTKIEAIDNFTIVNKYTQPFYKTRAWMCWDDTNFYTAYEMGDDDIWSNKGKHDEPVWEADNIEIYLDPDSDGKNYPGVEMGPLNSCIDLVLPAPWVEPWQKSAEWEMEGLKVVSRIDGTINFRDDTDAGWVAMIIMPFKSLEGFGAANIPPKEGDVWRANIWRFQRNRRGKIRLEDHAWSPTRDHHVPAEFGYIEFTKKDPFK